MGSRCLILLVEGPIQFSVISSRNFWEIQACLLAIPPKPSPADIIRSFIDTQGLKGQNGLFRVELKPPHPQGVCSSKRKNEQPVKVA